MKVLQPTVVHRWGHSEMLAGKDERAKREETARRFVSRSARDGRVPFQNKKRRAKTTCYHGGGEKPKKAPTIERLVLVKLL